MAERAGAGGVVAGGNAVIGHLTNLFVGGRAVEMHPVTEGVLLLVASQVVFAAVNYLRKWGELRVAGSRLADAHVSMRLPGWWCGSRRIFSATGKWKKSTRGCWMTQTRSGTSSTRRGGQASVSVISMVVFVMSAFMLMNNVFLGACKDPRRALLSRYFVLFDKKVQELDAADAGSVWDTISKPQGSEVVTMTPELRAGTMRLIGYVGTAVILEIQAGAAGDGVAPGDVHGHHAAGGRVVQTGTLYWLGQSRVGGSHDGGWCR